MFKQELINSRVRLSKQTNMIRINKLAGGKYISVFATRYNILFTNPRVFSSDIILCLHNRILVITVYTRLRLIFYVRSRMTKCQT